jgi:hypothetical protein
MTQPLNTLISDFRLAGIFGDGENLTATQMWVLEIEREDSTELRFVYGRTLPGTYQSSFWTGKTSSKTPLDEKCFAKTHALTLHTSSQRLKIFFEHFISGASLSTASQLADLTINEKLSAKVGSVTFGANPVVRPVMHLPTRDYYRFQSSRLSPTSLASVDSGAISPSAKSDVFSAPEGFDRLIAEVVCQALNADTGLDFAALDAWRTGDFEFICAPGLTAHERAKFDITLKGEQSSLKLFEPLTREPSDLLVVVTAYSDGSVQGTYVAKLEKHTPYPLDHPFTLDVFRSQISTAFTLEVYSVEDSGESFLLLKTGAYFARSMNLNMQIHDSIQSPASLGWLEKRVARKDRARLAEAARVSRSIHPSRSELGGHQADPWVPVNRLTENVVKELRPKPSAGRFFLTLTDSGGESRLELTEWLRDIFDSHHDAQIAWIDPFMEDVGIELLNRMGTSSGDYLIITTEKEPKDAGKEREDQPKRIDRLLSKCADWSNGYFGNVRLKVLAVPEQQIHDRMILIRSTTGRPVAGYHLSNSIQRANDNHPLLATPIPLDVLHHVFEYTDQILQNTVHGEGSRAPTAKLIFDSSTTVENHGDEREGANQPNSFVDAARAGDVFSWWLEDPELAGLSGAGLMELLERKGHFQDGQLDAHCFDVIPAKLWKEGFPLEDFNTAWDALGYVLAYSHAGSLYTEDKTLLPSALKIALLEYLVPTRENALQPRPRKFDIDVEHYRSQCLRTLLFSTDKPCHVFRYSPTDSSWGDYYAIKVLWSRDPEGMVNWLDSICSQPIEHARTRVLVNESFKHIGLELAFDKHPEQIDALLKSKAGVIMWIGLHAFKSAINDGYWGTETLPKIDSISDSRAILCWLINESNYVKSAIQPHLIVKLTESITAPLSDEELHELLEPLRGRLGRLHHLTPWILESLLAPLLEQKSIDTAQVTKKWLAELTTQWRAALDTDHVSFTLKADGAFTDELAVLTTYVAPADQEAIFDDLWKVFNSLARTIRQPLSAQVSWRSHNKAHEVNLWLYALARRIETLVHTEERQPLRELLQQSKSIIERLPAATLDKATTPDLLTYVKVDPGQIRAHSLHHTLRKALSE